MDREDLADFLRRRREALRPEDVGLPAGRRRRTAGLRREEVAALASMSTDFYARIEQRRGSRPPRGAIAAPVPAPPPPPPPAGPPLHPRRIRAAAARHPLRPRQPAAAADPRPPRRARAGDLG